MSDEEKKRERELKTETTDWLSANLGQLRRKFRAALSVDARLCGYVSDVVKHPQAHNLYEHLAVRRFFQFLGKYTFDKKRVRHFIKFYETIRLSGTTGRQRYKMTPVQVFQFANIFGFLDAEGRRLCRTAYLFVPRKFSKTTSTATVAVYDMLFGDNNAQAYIAANSYPQAKVCFDEIRAIMRDLDKREQHFRINREKITFKGHGRDSSITCLASNARTLDGLFASLVIVDEYAQARDTAGKGGADLRNVLTTSMGPRLEPLTMIITTASDVLDGPFARELEGVKAVLREDMENDLIFASLFMPDVDDSEDNPETWRKVQPHLGITVQSDWYAKEYSTARLSADHMLAFRTKLLNIFAQNEERAWISASFARKMMCDLTPQRLQDRPDAMVALDLSESDDFSSVSVGVYNADAKDFFFHTAYFFPEGALAGHPNEKLYRIWANEGHLRLTQGDVIDYREIVNYILDLNKYVAILQIGYDQWKSLDVINMLAASGANNVLRAVGQTYGNFTAPVQSFEHGAKTGQVHIDNNPINAYCFGNAVLDTDNLENCKPIKRQRYSKIDGVITMLMCLRLFIDYER